jgi:hypothetical protein
MTYANAFDPNFFLLLREIRATSLDHMQDATLEVESNILKIEIEEKVGFKLRLIGPLLPPFK